MSKSDVAIRFKPGDLVRSRGREWVVLPETRPDLMKLRPLGGAEDDATLIYLPLEPEPPIPATFDLPDPTKPGSHETALLLRDALRLKLRAGAGPFRSFGNLAVDPRAYQLVPLLMALKLPTVRLLIADDVGIGKTIEAGLIARELLDRGEIERLTVICPPHLCEQWRAELANKFHIDAEVVRSGSAARLERGLRPDESIFDVYSYTVVSLDYIKSDRRREDFLRACPDFVIVDEAHTCVQATAGRHQRYQLLQGLAASPARHIVMLTATPHSGNEDAFHNLLGLIDARFAALADMAEGATRRALREDLAEYFVQRRRVDIAEWNDTAGFPVRESAEATYKLTGAWGRLFDDVLAYARTLVRQTQGGSHLEQRMSWWAALALLRCVSSSPAAAALSLRTRLKAVAGVDERQQTAELEQRATQTVLDGDSDADAEADESVPAGTTQSAEEAQALKALIDRAEDLRGAANDPKLALLVDRIRVLLGDGFKPVVFCRYIATAHYVAEHLRAALADGKAHVAAITGELTPDQREERISELGELEEGKVPVLVATDCLSEGINLQRLFDAAVHYDLTWNPTRHEQREGRVDRFGQGSKKVRALMLYAEDNPVDGAVLRVILRKAEKIRKELGVALPLPADTNKIVEAIMKAVLLHTGSVEKQARQLRMDLGEAEEEVDAAWATARERATRTVFAQRRLKPADVLPEWEKAVSALGGEQDVERFVRSATARLGAPLEKRKDHVRLPTAHLPPALQERLEAVGIARTLKLGFGPSPPSGVDAIYRSHPLVSALADFIAEQALDIQRPDLAARCAAIFTRSVECKTIVYLLRLRYHINVEARAASGQFELKSPLLAEECLGIAVHASERPQILADADALALLSLTPDRNMEEGQKTQLVRQALDALPALASSLTDIATRRAAQLLDDHRRVREASDAKGIRYVVAPALPVDVIGAYVLMPMTSA